MIIRHRWLLLILLLSALLLVACLGEAANPELEPVPGAILVPKAPNPTVAAAPRLSLDLSGQPMGADHPIPQIPHDLIGRSDCLMCHKQGVSGAGRIPDAHRGLDSSTCQTCHTAPASAELSGPEMYSRVCARCHGEQGEGSVGPALNTKSFLQSVSDTELRAAIDRGRGAGEMLAWGDLGLITERQVDDLVSMIRGWEPTAPETAGRVAMAPASASDGDPDQGERLFAQFCTGCHGFHGETAVGDNIVLQAVVSSQDDTSLAQWIRDGSQEMPSFHALLSTQDINDLLALMRTWQAGPQPTATPIELSGEDVFARVCARCHGRSGEGGIGPPLNSKEFLAENDDTTIREWIQLGTLGTSMMSWGDLGLLSDHQIEELVAYIRAWEPNAPSTAGSQITAPRPRAEAGDAVHGQQLFAQFCSGCHGLQGERSTGGMVLGSEEFLGAINDEILASQIQNGGRAMPAFHAILTTQDVNDLLAFMRSGFSVEEQAASPSFSMDVLPILEEDCGLCHGTAGGWGAGTYEEVMESGNNAPVIIPGNPEGSLLVQKLRDTQMIGGPMPPAELLPEEDIELIARWIAEGAVKN